jgi:hypothetical protein
MAVADAFNPDPVRLFIQLADYSRVRNRPSRHKGSSFQRGTQMLRLALAIAIAAPLLSGCIIVSTEKPTTRVITAPASGQ